MCVQYNCVIYMELLDGDPEVPQYVQSQYNSLKSDRLFTQLVHLHVCTNVAAADNSVITVHYGEHSQCFLPGVSSCVGFIVVLTLAGE
jgi:hypothetical protein